MSAERIAIVGIGLRYPDASTTGELWENVLAGRRAFRQLPDERMNRADYWSADPAAPDRFYSERAAVLRDFEFDRMKYKVAGSTFRSTDMTHWLALDVAARALADAGFEDGEGLPKQRTGVVLGNSLTGEFSRANLMRLRWPYVRRTVAAALAEKGWGEDETDTFLRDLEVQYKAPFPEINEDSLAGGLANTIAGRICNYFDLAGGGFTVDGACSSSLLSIVTAANALTEGDLDVAIAGGVDLSIDPFEVIGFAKTGALATGEMKVYDKDSNGFWPGEGSGILVLMREQEALDRGARVYASISGWGVSSDGKGGITRPEAAGHQLALERAYARAGYGAGTVSYFEGHGTGTALGDATEIEALSNARNEAAPEAEPAVLGTVKGNFGHTKAAAGVAGLIKAALSVYHQVIPPVTGNSDPHPLLSVDAAAMRVTRDAELWPDDQPIRAGVSAMGFGGINTHVAVTQAPEVARRSALDERTRAIVNGRQDAELLLLDASDVADLSAQVGQLLELVGKLAFAELTDLAAALAGELAGKRLRAAVIVANPEDAERKLTRLADMLSERVTSVFAAAEGIFVSDSSSPARIGFLFPGQGSGRGARGAIRRRFAAAEEVFGVANLPEAGDQVATEVAQPRIVAGSLAGLEVLRGLGLEAGAAAGHSLGELTALHWAGAMDGKGLLRLAAVRGKVMATASAGGGAMASIGADPTTAAGLAGDSAVVVAGYNAPGQTVLSGPAEDIEQACANAQAEGLTATRLNVSHAFHSPLVEPASAAMAEHLGEFEFERLARPVYSTVTGEALHAAEDLRALLQDQIVLPVRFREAADKVAEQSDLVVELGPGGVLTGLLSDIAPGTLALSLDTESESLRGLLGVVGAAYALGAPVDISALFAGRVVRPLPLDGDMTFLASPCEQAPGSEVGISRDDAVDQRQTPAAAGKEPERPSSTAGTLDLLRELAAERVELPLDAVTADTHPLDDLHLSSITVGQLVNDVTRTLGRPPLEGMPNFATVCLGELAEMIDELAQTEQQRDTTRTDSVPGVAPWVRPFAVEYVRRDRPAVDVATGAVAASWSVYAPGGHPLAESLLDALTTAGVGDGVLLCLPAECGEGQIGLFLDAARAVLAAPNGTRFVVVQHGLGGSAVAKTLRLEDPSARTTIVDLPDVVPVAGPERDEAITRVVAEVAGTTDFTEVRYDHAGTRTVPALRTLEPNDTEDAGPPLGGRDVVMVTGGGKGITAESALAIAQDSGAGLLLLGRSDPEDDAELSENLSRMSAAGVRFYYAKADVTSAEQVAEAVADGEARLGRVTGVLHGAGRNEPAALFSLTDEAFRRTLEPKIGGLRNVLSAVDPDRIKLLVTFGSIIGRAGLRGEAHYATANDWMTELTTRFQTQHPNARVHALEWSVWSGAGMGERLGVVEALQRDGVTPIPTEDGIAVLRQVLFDPAAPPVVLVCGRTAGIPTLPVPRGQLPLTRFVDRAVVHYPGIELVTEADLSPGSDPYLADHELDGSLLFPAVMGMEAMTQVAAALTGDESPPLLENVEFLRPVAVPPGGSATIRIAALVRDEATVDVVLRSADTGYSADHFRATLRLPRPDVEGDGSAVELGLPRLDVDPVTELYGSVLFQGKRFQRLTAYRQAGARRAVAELSTGAGDTWFASFLPQQRLLADPGTRDAAMHAIQCCVPDATLLPQGIERLYLNTEPDQDAGQVVLDARERSQDGDTYVYDLDIIDESGVTVERWEGLSLRAVRKRDGAGPWVPSMLGPHIERALERVLGGGRAVIVEPDRLDQPAESTAQRREQTALAVSRALGEPVTPRYRPDGKPEIDGSYMSASHSAGLTLAVTGSNPLTCDVQAVAGQAENRWADLLGADPAAVAELLAEENGEDMDVAGTRVWSALECVRKTGAMAESLALHRAHQDGWVVLSAGTAKVATWVTTVNQRSEPVVFAVLGGEEA